MKEEAYTYVRNDGKKLVSKKENTEKGIKME